MAEAQRLIAVSLGKIAQNRGQRGGASLYKNLLVSTVLHKARHAFMTENFTAMLQARKAQAEKEKEEKCVSNTKDSVVMEPPSRPSTPAPVIDAGIKEDKENTPPPSTNSMESNISEDQKAAKTETSCAKCVKRRLTDVQANGTLCETTSPNKRAKYDTNEKSDLLPHDDVSSSNHEPMQTEQITNLVSRFNSGLSGFLGNSSSVNVDPKSNCQSDTLVSSCGNQVTFSESLGPRPVIALTV